MILTYNVSLVNTYDGSKLGKKSLGFIGGEWVTLILFEGLKRAGAHLPKVLVSNTNRETLLKQSNRFPNVEILSNDNRRPSSARLVFLALHSLGRFWRRAQPKAYRSQLGVLYEKPKSR